MAADVEVEQEEDVVSSWLSCSSCSHTFILRDPDHERRRLSIDLGDSDGDELMAAWCLALDLTAEMVDAQERKRKTIKMEWRR